LIANVPTWIWASLIMIAFVVVSAIAMWLVRFPIERRTDRSESNDTPPHAS
jgi:hypothetical protein